MVNICIYNIISEKPWRRYMIATVLAAQPGIGDAGPAGGGL